MFQLLNLPRRLPSLLAASALSSALLSGLFLACASDGPKPPPSYATSLYLQAELKGVPPDPDSKNMRLERVSTAVPFPRGLVLKDGDLFALSRGRGREAGGPAADVDDQAGTIHRLDPRVFERVTDEQADPSAEVIANGVPFARPTEPPFLLWDRTASPPTADNRTDRPYCTLRFDARTHSFYLCAYSGIDMAEQPGRPSFDKNPADGLLRYDLRTSSWHVVERHEPAAEGKYPHHDPSRNSPPHGWLNGPDNCEVVGDWLYAVSKDNCLLVRYDLRAIQRDPSAGPPPSEVVLGSRIPIRGQGERWFYGHSSLAWHAGWLYMGFRTSAEVVRMRVDEAGEPLRPIEVELLALFRPYDPVARKSSNITDIAVDSEGRVYVLSASPSRVWRFTPDPSRIFDFRDGRAAPYVDFAGLTGDPTLKSENILVDDQGRVYATAGNAYAYQQGATGAIWRAVPEDA
jgi:hypothetical protein